MNCRRASGLLLLAVCSLSSAGCDPVRTTSQTVHLQVLDAASGQPLAGALVRLKYDYRHFDPAKPPPSRKDLPRLRINWREYPWSNATSDSTGTASIHIKSTDIDSTRGPTPPPWRDSITGKSYIIGVRHGDVPPETFALVIRDGESVSSKSYKVVVMAIEDPFYLDTTE